MFTVVSLIKKYFAFNVKACLEYRAAFIGQLFAVFINNGAFMLFWFLIYSKVGGSINGYSYKDIVLLWGVIASAFGWSEVLFGNGKNITRIIYTGELDIFILQPKPVLPNLVCSKMVMLGWGDALYGLVTFFLVFGLDPIRLVLFIIYTVTGAVVFTGFRVIIHSLTFYLGNVQVLSATLINTLLGLGTYPATIFRGPILFLLYTALPVGFIAFLPVESLNSFSIKTFVYILLGDSIFVALAIWIFYLGLKKYESGNIIGSRM